MKRIISALLVVMLLCSMFVVSVAAENADSTIMIPASKLEKKFVVDGNLDIWYLNADDETPKNDGNYYQYVALSPIEKSDGVSYYADPVTFAQGWTAWDDDYVYIYVKVWDDHLVKFDPSGAHAGMDSSAADCVGVFFDPDPNSQTHEFVYDTDKHNGNIIDEIQKEAPLDNFFAQTSDPEQGDTQFRWRPLEDQIDDYHNVVKPGYNGVTFADYITNTDNLVTFTFENDPIIVEETGTEVTSGFGFEVRLPRNNDKSNSYRFHLYAANSSDENWSRYTLATGNAWWMQYDTAWGVYYYDDAPFFNQSEEQLATKGVMYTDSEINLRGPAGAVVEKIKALGNVTAADKDKVLALKAEYDALTVIEKGYVEYKDCLETLEAAVEAVGGDVTPPDNTDQEAADAVMAQIDALNVQSLDDEAAVVAARTAYDALTDAQKALVTNLAKLEAAEAAIAALKADVPGPAVKYGDVNGDGKDDAADALDVLKSVVGKVSFNADQFKAADTDGDGKADAADALNILKKVVGKLDKYPVE